MNMEEGLDFFRKDEKWWSVAGTLAAILGSNRPMATQASILEGGGSRLSNQEQDLTSDATQNWKPVLIVGHISGDMRMSTQASN